MSSKQLRELESTVVSVSISIFVPICQLVNFEQNIFLESKIRREEIVIRI